MFGISKGFPGIIKPPSASPKNFRGEYMQSIFDAYQEGDEDGYFIVSFNSVSARYYYGFITETSIYYHQYKPDIPPIVIDPDDDEGGMCFGWEPIKSESFGNLKDAQAWAHANGRKDGYCYTINYNKATGKYLVIISVWVPPPPKPGGGE